MIVKKVNKKNRKMEHTDRDALLDTTESHESSNDPDGHRELPVFVQIEPCFLKKVLSASVYSIAQTLIGINVGVTLWFAFKSTPITKFQLHVGLSVLGYQLLMTHGFLCLQSTSWSALSVQHRRRVHWVLQLSGSILAMTGSALMFKSKSDAGKSHFSSVHGKLALAALVFTCASLVNGLLSLYAVELRHLIPAKATKLSHILFGTAAFVTSSACLAIGFNKKSFVEWGSQEFAYVMIGIVSVYTALIVVLPLNNILNKIARYWKIKIC